MNVILYGKGNFAYMVQFRIMKWEDYYELGFYLCIWAINIIINVFFKDRNHRFDYRKGECDVMILEQM